MFLYIKIEIKLQIIIFRISSQSGPLFVYLKNVYDYTCDRDLVRKIFLRITVSEKKKHQIILYKY